MNPLTQFWPWITETLEQANENQQEKNAKELKEKYSLEFSTKIAKKIKEILNNLDSSLIKSLTNEDEKEEVISRLEAIYINNKSKWLEFNLNKELINTIKSMSFEAAWKTNNKEYLQKNQEIRQKLIEQLKKYFKEKNTKKNQDNFSKKENTKEKSQENSQEKPLEENQKVQENKYFPYIKELHNQEEIPNDTYNKILEWLKQEKKLDDIINQLENPEIKEKLKNLKSINNEKSKEKNINKFKETINNFDNIEWLENIKEAFKEQKKDSIYLELWNMIWANYIDIDQSKQNPEINIKTAIEATWNTILEKYPSVKKMSDTQMYKNAFKDIKSWNIKKQVEWLKNILLIASTISYAWMDKQKKALLKPKLEEQYKERLKEINNQIKQIEEKLKNNKEKNNKELQEKLNNLKKEKEEITSWEIFQKASKIDKNKKSSEKKEAN